MARWASIHYRDFFDIPRIFLVRDDVRVILFESKFDTVKDDYDESYHVFEMPELAESILEGSWEELSSRALQELGSIPTSNVRFDETLRRFVDLDCLSGLEG